MKTTRSVILNSHDGLLCAEVGSAGGMLNALTFRPGTPQAISVLYRAHWLDNPQVCAGQPPLMHRLAGEWVGVPFGHTEQDDHGYYHHAPHGLPVNGEWEITAIENNRAQLNFHFPQDYPLAELQRTIMLAENGCVDFSLTLIARRDCRLPVGLHPIFPVGGNAGEVELEIDNMAQGIVYPQATEAGISQLRPLALFDDLTAIPSLQGHTLDISQLPLPFATEEIVQINQPVSGVTLRYPRRQFCVSLQWDSEILPHCLLWISNGGRSMSPWDGKNYCLGIEPICSAWDLGPGSLKENAINQMGYPTALSIRAEQPVTIYYRLICQSLNGN
ncbi:hypothetical protein [Brenneria uluponensis]|uniref:hypothetical protein n=1 Tax=Brenneria uluponensis TaxID=3057057 RepID=UPI0028EB99D0|nr:hypothetical protein [Brenneria ulupoensis]